MLGIKRYFAAFTMCAFFMAASLSFSLFLLAPFSSFILCFFLALAEALISVNSLFLMIVILAFCGSLSQPQSLLHDLDVLDSGRSSSCSSSSFALRDYKKNGSLLRVPPASAVSRSMS